MIINRIPRRLDTILANIKIDNPTWKWSRSALYEAMKSIGITFRTRGHWHYEVMREDEANSLRRAKYLSYFFKYEEEGRSFDFFDQSWLNQNMVEDEIWSDGTMEMEGVVPEGKGRRWIMMGCGNRSDGWTHFIMWEGDHTTDDYHGNMNAELMKKFVDEWLIKAKDKSVLVIDRAPYHMMLTPETRRAIKSMTRKQLAEWLLDHNAKDDDGELYTRQYLLTDRFQSITKTGGTRAVSGLPKLMLYEMCRARDPAPKYQIQQWFDNYNNANNGRDLKVLILPVAHPRLNPIEDMWREIKYYVRMSNFDFNMQRIRTLALAKKATQDSAIWEKYYQKMLKYAYESWEADEILLEDPTGGDSLAEEGPTDEDPDDMDMDE
jgi:hypothetical protein